MTDVFYSSEFALDSYEHIGFRVNCIEVVSYRFGTWTQFIFFIISLIPPSDLSYLCTFSTDVLTQFHHGAKSPIGDLEVHRTHDCL